MSKNQSGGHAFCPQLRLPIVIVLLLVFAVLAPISHAQASSYTYADNIETQVGQERLSGQRPTVSGGSAWVILAMGEQTITTYYSHPGYTVIASQTTDTSLINTMRHERVSNAHSKCHFNIPNVSGTGYLTCKVFS